jgi:hypothetical protein
VQQVSRSVTGIEPLDAFVDDELGVRQVVHQRVTFDLAAPDVEAFALGLARGADAAKA